MQRNIWHLQGMLLWRVFIPKNIKKGAIHGIN